MDAIITTRAKRTRPGTAPDQQPATTSALVATPPVPCVLVKSEASAAEPATSGSAQFSTMLSGSVLHGLARSLGLGESISSHQCFQYMRDLLTEGSQASDPLATSLIHTAAVGQMAAGLLALKAAVAANSNDASAYSSAAAKLLTEARRSVTTASQMRSGASPATDVNQVVAQQNVATAPPQVAFVAAGKKVSPKTELGHVEATSEAAS